MGTNRRADTYDVMGEGSFPASDPPAVWTWEVEKPEPAETDEPLASRHANAEQASL
jgi:hypothetical protein